MAKKGLGRGLDILLGDNTDNTPAAQQSVTDLDKLPIEMIVPDPEQPRKHFADEAIEELALSIRARGLLQPILVRPAPAGEGEEAQSWLIVAGERRWRAAQRARLHEVPVVIRSFTDDQAAEIALIENVQRVDLNPLEEAEAYHRLAERHDRSQADIANAVGKSRSHIANMMRLTALPASVKEHVRQGHLSMGHARAILSADYPDKVARLVLERGLSVRQTEDLVRELKDGEGRKSKSSSGEAPSSAPKKDADTRALERDISEALGLTVTIDHAGKKGGTVTVSYSTLDQLDDLCARLGAR